MWLKFSSTYRRRWTSCYWFRVERITIFLESTLCLSSWFPSIYPDLKRFLYHIHRYIPWEIEFLTVTQLSIHYFFFVPNANYIYSHHFFHDIINFFILKNLIPLLYSSDIFSWRTQNYSWYEMIMFCWLQNKETGEGWFLPWRQRKFWTAWLFS